MFLDHVKRTIDRYQLLEKGDRLIVGVSAGMDSMVLLHLLNGYCLEFKLSLIVAHVNHSLRPDESEKEAELVRNESKRLGLPFEYGQFDVKGFQKRRGLSLQDAARRIRFGFFKNLLLKYQAQKIALGHHADDQVETVLLALIRGSGLKGLKGMLPIREGRIIRPLLEVWKEEIESFAKEMGIPYLLDSSNTKRNYLRNRLRLALIPLIENEYQPKLKKIVLKTSAILREENDYLEREVEEVFQKMVRQGKGVFCFKFSEYQSLHQAIRWRIVQKILEKILCEGICLEEEGWFDVSSIYKRLDRPIPSFLLELPHGLFFEKRYDMVSFGKGRVESIPSFEMELVVPGRTFIKEIKREVVIEEMLRDDKIKDLYKLADTALLDYQNLQFPLKIRNFRPGDRFQPLGVKGAQKLKEFFIDHKVPQFERPRIPLLVSGEMIAWVIGHRIDERVKITEKTKKVLRIKVT